MKSVFAFLLSASLLLASAPSNAQSQTLLPAPINSTIGATSNVACTFSTYCITTSEPVSIGQELFVCIAHDNNSLPPWTITDDSGSNSWTMEATTGTTSFTSPGSSSSSIINIALAHAVSTTNGVLNIQIGFPGGHTFDTYDYGFVSFPSSVSDTLDGAILTSNSNSPSKIPTTTNTHTTTVNGGVAIGCLAGTINTGSTIPTPISSNMIMRGGGILGMQYTNLGAAGSHPIDAGAFNGDGNSRVGLLSAIFKPSSLMFTDTALPQAALGVAYDAQLHTIGGSSSVAHSVLSGGMPVGLSMDSLGHITGTPTTAGTASLTFQASSGSSTATTTLNLVVGASFGTPTLRQSPLTGDYNVNPGSHAFPSPVGCGDVILMCFYASDDTHGGTSWLQQIDGASNYYKDTFGSPIQRIPTFAGVYRGPSSCVLLGPTTQSGTDTLSAANNQAASNGLAFVAYDFQNVQALVEPGNLFHVNPAAGSTSTTLTVNFDTVVPNQYAFNIMSAQDAAATLPTPTGWTNDLAAPGAGFGATSFNSKTFAAAGAQSVSSTSTYSSGSPQNDSSMVVTLRPSIPSSSCPISPGPRHRTDVK